jgi:hypothetical protein
MWKCIDSVGVNWFVYCQKDILLVSKKIIQQMWRLGVVSRRCACQPRHQQLCLGLHAVLQGHEHGI